MASDEWSQEDFIKRMKDQFPNNMKDGDSTILTNWMNQQEFDIFHREMLFNIIGMKHTYRTFPLPAKIRIWWEGRDGGPKEEGQSIGIYGRLQADIISKTRNYTPKKIAEIYDMITSEYIGTDEPVPLLRMMHVIFWEPLVTRFKVCLDKGWIPELADSYCEPIKQSLLDGVPVGYSISGIEDRRTPEEIDMAKVKTKALLSTIVKNLRISKTKENSYKSNRREKSLQNDRDSDY